MGRVCPGSGDLGRCVDFTQKYLESCQFAPSTSLLTTTPAGYTVVPRFTWEHAEAPSGEVTLSAPTAWKWQIGAQGRLAPQPPVNPSEVSFPEGSEIDARVCSRALLFPAPPDSIGSTSKCFITEITSSKYSPLGWTLRNGLSHQGGR